jgi:opacity protein-like surface antigen
MIMSKVDGAIARRVSVLGARALSGCAAVAMAVAAIFMSSASSAEAAYDQSTWSGYGDHGYVGKAKTQRKSSFQRGIRKQVHRGERRSRSASRKTASRKRYAALGSTMSDATAPKAPRLSGGGGIRWVASSGCLNSTLRSVVAQVAANYGSVTVNSTCRSRSRNARVGGARKSHHLTGNAVDFRVRGGGRGVYAFLRSLGGVGGVKHYGGGLYHVDTGPRRSW